MSDEFDPTEKLDLDKLASVAKDIPEEVILCEKCGEETGVKTIGDESYDWCSECNWATHV